MNVTTIFLVISILLNIFFVIIYISMLGDHDKEIKTKEQQIEKLESDIAECVVIFKEFDQLAEVFNKILFDDPIDYSNYLEEFQAIEELSRKVYDFSEKDYCTYLFNSMHLAGKIQEKVPKRNSTKELEYIVQHALDKKFRDGLNEIPIGVIFEDQLH